MDPNFKIVIYLSIISSILTTILFNTAIYGSPVGAAYEELFFTDDTQVGTGSIEVTKEADGNGGSFEFEMVPGEKKFTITTKDGEGIYTIDNLEPRDYGVFETRPDKPWEKLYSTCENITVVAGKTTKCRVVNSMLGSIVVRKEVRRELAGEWYTDTKKNDKFDFKATYPNGDVWTFTIHVKNGLGWHTLRHLYPGTYSIKEITHPDYETWDCDDITITAEDIANGGSVYCFVRNYHKFPKGANI